jgi:spectinomycin phosphotransferase
MLEKPDIQDEKIITCLQNDYGIVAVQVTFLPLGYDINAAVYRVVADDQRPYFLKLKRGAFDEISVALPKFLSDQGIAQIIAPLSTKTGQLWTGFDAYKLILYPFVEGQNAYEVSLSDRHWRELGTALKRIHTVAVPPALIRRVQQETYPPQWREIVKSFQERVETETFDEPVAAKLAAFLHSKCNEILDLVERTEQLAQVLQTQSPELVVCHSDIHAGNLLISTDDSFYIVDWDNPILAPKERDLMYVGGGLVGGWRTPQEEETPFYEGYGDTEIDPVALAYYRYERIVQDIAAFCEQLFLSDQGGDDREQSFYYLTSSFLPNQVLEIAYKSDKTLGTL